MSLSTLLIRCGNLRSSEVKACSLSELMGSLAATCEVSGLPLILDDSVLVNVTVLNRSNPDFALHCIVANHHVNLYYLVDAPFTVAAGAPRIMMSSWMRGFSVLVALSFAQFLN